MEGINRKQGDALTVVDVSSGAGHAVQGCEGVQLEAIACRVMAALAQTASAAPGKISRNREAGFSGPSSGEGSAAAGGDGGR